MTVSIVIGDCRQQLGQLADSSVHCVVTSPPYFGLRDYGVEGQIGLEATPDAFVAELVAVFREVRRVLRDDGTLWLNLGDSYAGSWGAQAKREVPGEYSRNSVRNHPKRASHTGAIRQAGLKPKDLMGVPWRVAFALQADGWWLRQDIIWHKPNPMPESITDRCTKAHEYLFLLTKSDRYYFDAEAIQERASYPEGAGNTQSYQVDGQRPGDNANIGGSIHKIGPRETRNKRSVWSISPEPFREAHFATFPPALVEPCILAGCPAGGVVLDPFGGAGTTGLVADRHGRDAILIELNPSYAAIADRRLRAGLARVNSPPAAAPGDLPLFGGEAA